MSEAVSAKCGFCGKGFRLRPEQLGREVRCPHCKTLCRIMPRTETAREAIEALAPELHHARPVTTHRHVVLPTGGVRTKSVAIVWVVLLGLVLVALVIVGAVAWLNRPEPAATPSSSSGAPPAPYAGPGTQGGTTPALPAPVAAPAPREPVTVEIEHLVRGMKHSTQTYAVGTVTNQTPDTLRAVEVEVTIFDKEDRQLGLAHAWVRDLGPGETAPVVAIWEHDPAVSGVKFVPGCRIADEAPTGPPHRLEVEGDPWTMVDPGGFADTGRVHIRVANKGVQAVEGVEVTAVMRGTDGAVVGATREVVSSRIMPGKSDEIEVPYERCPARLIHYTEVRVQSTGR